jgi:hypothetical protein
MNPILLTVWAVLTACFFALLLYRGMLTRYEEDQIFLSDEINPHEELQMNVIRKVQKIEPIVRIVGGAAGLVTVCAVGIYVYQAWRTIQ